MHSTTSGRWEDVIASALLPPPVGGGENPIWSKSVESRDGARTGRPAPPPRRTSPGRRPLPGTVIGPAPRGRPRTEPPPVAGPLLSAVPAASRRVCFSPLPHRRPLPRPLPLHPLRSPRSPRPPRASALRRSPPHPQLSFAPLPPNHPVLRSPCFPFCLLRRPLHL